MKNKEGFETVDEYVASLPEDTRKVLKKLRAAIQAAAPGAREKVSYQIGALELNGRNLLGFAGWKNHVSLYPIPSGSAAFNREIAKYADGKGTIKFPLDKPLPLKLIRQVVKYRMMDNLGYEKPKAKKKS